ncbi:Tetratricopeptide repeat protein [compost metagenome]
MKSKILRSHTIIPSKLYVKRRADFQIKNIVEDMGRPGYVLVSRQMGKTNLLLNAKRELEDSDHIFIYADLSNSFPTIEQFFRHIIDIALETNGVKFKNVEDRIYLAREEKRNIPAHREHEQELRLLLQCVTGKIVICLDEIDALTNSVYSDSVFSLIRSTYFASRINFSEFNRLTYILSGVAEPNEIIKNKNISPFNIGEKIFLDDFSILEFNEFLKKSDLHLSQENIDRIFYWTSGNPRICWDVCSAIEDQLISGVVISPDVIDKVIQRLYLLEYDLAPVDHIRKIVEEDRDIRNAVINIHYKKFSSISDVQKNRLYLAGIIKSDYSGDFISIKNRIIEYSLNESWISDIENSKVSVFDLAVIKLKDGRYSDALILFSECENNTALIEDEKAFFHNYAKCYYLMGNYESAIEYFLKSPYKKSKAPLNYHDQNIQLGLSYSRLGMYEESIRSYRNVIDSDFSEGDYPLYYFQCLLNISGVYFNFFEKYVDEIKKINLSVIDEEKNILEIPDKSGLGNTLIVAAFNNIATLERILGKKSDAIVAWNEAIVRAKISERPKFLLDLISVLPKRDAIEQIDKIVSLLIENKLMPVSPELHIPFSFSVSSCIDLIVIASELKQEKSIKALVNYFCLINSPNFDVWRLLVSAGVSIMDSNEEFAVFLFSAALGLPISGIEEFERKSIMQYVLIVDKLNNRVSYEKQYLLYVSNDGSEKFSDADIRIICEIINRDVNIGNDFSARSVIENIKNIFFDIGCQNFNDIPDASERAFLLLDYVEFRIFVLEDKFYDAKRKALYVNEKIGKGYKLSKVFHSALLRSVANDVDNFLMINQVGERKFGSSGFKKYKKTDIVTVRYQSGIEKKSKYKNVKFDIISGYCVIVSD